MFMLRRPHSSEAFNAQLHRLQAVADNNVLSIAGLDVICHHLDETRKTNHYQFPLPQNRRSTLLNSFRNNGTIADPVRSSADHLR
jgi:hypothetical protein